MRMPIRSIYPALASTIMQAWKPLAVVLLGFAILQ